MTDRPERATAAWLALLLFAIYLLSFSGRIYSSDGLSMFAVTESLVKRGEFSTDQMWTFFGTKSVPAPDGEVYSKYGYGTSLLAAPLYALALVLPFAGLMQVTLLASGIAVAVTGALVYLSARRLNYSRGVSVIAALLFGLATPAWVYAKEFWSESFSLVTLFAAFYALQCYRASREKPGFSENPGFLSLISGIALGLAIAVRTTNALLVPIYFLYVFAPPTYPLPPPYKGRGEKPNRSNDFSRSLTVFLAPILVSLFSVALYNAVRFGNPLTTGYRADETFSNPLLLGAYGLLFSPGKGLLVYAPFLAALPFGIWQFYRRTRRELLLILALFAIYLIVFSLWYYWWGGTNWAARFLVPTLPFLVLLCAPLVELIWQRTQTPNPAAPSAITNYELGITNSKSRLSLLVLSILFSLLVLVSVVNEIAGVSISSLTYRLRTLNLSPTPDADAIFVPSFSPLIGYWQTLKPTNLDFAWIRATPGQVQIDWLVVLLTLGFIVFCGFMLARSNTTGDGGRRTDERRRRTEDEGRR